MIKIIKQEYDKNGNRTYCEWSNGYWVKSEYDDHGNETYWEYSDGFWVKHEYNDHSRETYYENSRGYWEKYEYNDNGNRTFYENSRGEWEKWEYDDHDNCTYYENSDGGKIGIPRAESKTDDLINRNEVLETIFNIMSDNKIVHKHRALNRNIKQIPKADTNRYAHWIKRSDIDYDDGGLGTAHFICSNCNEDKEFYTDDSVEFCLDNFCSNCGCKMNKADNV